MNKIDSVIQLVSLLYESVLCVTTSTYVLEIWLGFHGILTQGYIPSTQDVLHCQTPTIGINEEVFNINDKFYRFVTMGGARNSRGRWIRAFDDLTSVLYFSAASEFDQALQEDAAINSLTESVGLFEMITSNRLLKSIPTVLILNKTDLLAEKIKTKSIRDYFPDFEVRKTTE